MTTKKPRSLIHQTSHLNPSGLKSSAEKAAAVYKSSEEKSKIEKDHQHDKATSNDRTAILHQGSSTNSHGDTTTNSWKSGSSLSSRSTRLSEASFRPGINKDEYSGDHFSGFGEEEQQDLTKHRLSQYNSFTPSLSASNYSFSAAVAPIPNHINADDLKNSLAKESNTTKEYKHKSSR